jgi:hypothetical protein
LGHPRPTIAKGGCGRKVRFFLGPGHAVAWVAARRESGGKDDDPAGGWRKRRVIESWIPSRFDQQQGF